MQERAPSRLPPGPSSIVPGRLAYGFTADRLAFLRNLTGRYGDAVFFRIAGEPFAILNHPDFVRDVLVTNQAAFHKGIGLERARMLLGDGLLTSEDAAHARNRRLIQPAFHRERISVYGATMVEYTERWSRRVQPGVPIDLAREMSALTLAIAGKTLFDADVERDQSRVGAALTAALASFNLALLPFGATLVRLPIPAARRFRRARAELDAVIYRLIADRRASGATGGDVLSLLIAARDSDHHEGHEGNEAHEGHEGHKGNEGHGGHGGLSDEQVRDEVLTLLLAGHETTANALSWTWHLLSQHPDVERMLHAEVDALLPSRAPTFDDVPKLPFARAVLAESMRLFPPAYLLGRRALTAYRPPGTPYELPPRTVVFLSQHLLHRDARFWVEPERFDPLRWLGEAHPATHRYAYFPFGAGPRICIGEHFAWMEGVLVLAALARRWRFVARPGTTVQPSPIVTLRLKGGLDATPHLRGRD